MNFVNFRHKQAVKKFAEGLGKVEIVTFEDAIAFYTGNSETVENASQPVEDVKPVEDDSQADSVWIASKLRLEVAKDTRPKIHRAFAIWATLPEKALKNHWLVSDVIALYVKRLGLCEREIRRIIDAGNSVFWTIHHNKYLQFFGKQTVYDIYQLDKPGVAQLVPVSGLLGSLKSLRYWLQAGIFNGRKTANITREQIEQETGFNRHQQLSYEAEVNAQKLPQFVYNPKKNETKQTANRYSNPSPKRKMKRAEMFGIRVGGDCTNTDSSTYDKKSFFSLYRDAKSKADKLDRQNLARPVGYLAKERSNWAVYYAV